MVTGQAVHQSVRPRISPLMTLSVFPLQALGHAGLTKRPTSCMLVLPKPLKGETATDEEGVKYTESFQELQKKVNAVQVAF